MVLVAEPGSKLVATQSSSDVLGSKSDCFCGFLMIAQDPVMTMKALLVVSILRSSIAKSTRDHAIVASAWRDGLAKRYVMNTFPFPSWSLLHYDRIGKSAGLWRIVWIMGLYHTMG